jgi:predicted transcriptional regulator
MASAELISFVARSKRRREVLKLLLKVQKMSQPEIMRNSKQYKSHNSRTLKELIDNKIISCINPEDRAFKFYKITKKGKNILKEVEKIIN